MLDKYELEDILEFNELEPIDVLVYLVESGMIVVDDLDDELEIIDGNEWWQGTSET